MSVPSLSEAKAVMPTEVPMVAFSETVFAFVSVSEMVLTEASDVSSVRLIENVSVEVEPSVDVAVTSIVWLVAVS